MRVSASGAAILVVVLLIVIWHMSRPGVKPGVNVPYGNEKGWVVSPIQ